jgi:hypothetical protein
MYARRSPWLCTLPPSPEQKGGCHCGKGADFPRNTARLNNPCHTSNTIDVRPHFGGGWFVCTPAKAEPVPCVGQRQSPKVVL